MTIKEALKSYLENEPIAIQPLSRLVGLSREEVTKKLSELILIHIVAEGFIVQCKNPDDDLVHAFQLSSSQEVNRFVRNNKNICPHCQMDLDNEVRRVFIKK